MPTTRRVSELTKQVAELEAALAARDATIANLRERPCAVAAAAVFFVGWCEVAAHPGMSHLLEAPGATYCKLVRCTRVCTEWRRQALAACRLLTRLAVPRALAVPEHQRIDAIERAFDRSGPRLTELALDLAGLGANSEAGTSRLFSRLVALSERASLTRLCFHACRSPTTQQTTLFDLALREMRFLVTLKQLQHLQCMSLPRTLSKALADVLDQNLLPELRVLNLQNSRVSNSAAKTLGSALASSMPFLEEFLLGGCEINPVGVEALAAGLVGKESILLLDFQMVRGAHSLAQALTTLTKLDVLYLGKSLQVEEFRSLAPSLASCTRLEAVGLEGNRIDDEGDWPSSLGSTVECGSCSSSYARMLFISLTQWWA